MKRLFGARRSGRTPKDGTIGGWQCSAGQDHFPMTTRNSRTGTAPAMRRRAKPALPASLEVTSHITARQPLTFPHAARVPSPSSETGNIDRSELQICRFWGELIASALLHRLHGAVQMHHAIRACGLHCFLGHVHLFHYHALFALRAVMNPSRTGLSSSIRDRTSSSYPWRGGWMNASQTHCRHYRGLDHRTSFAAQIPPTSHSHCLPIAAVPPPIMLKGRRPRFFEDISAS